MTMKYPPRSELDVVALIGQNPLCWIVSAGVSGFGASPLPLLPECADDGTLIALFGHCALANPQVALLRETPRSLVLVNGPQAYISPELVSNPTWVPTWNYTGAAITVDVEFVPQETRESIERLTNVMEAGRAAPWQVSDAEARLPAMLPHIIAFRAHVRAIDGRFKLGRDESLGAINQIINGMTQGPLRDWMRLYNSDRLDSVRAEGTTA
ncbi:MAG: FMN-binding negative transcriptional regulator [Sphingomonadaceae bacterium]|nr:FMN-binding negative transcriptional regulator [Sphingomonadaceae bacterium]